MYVTSRNEVARAGDRVSKNEVEDDTEEEWEDKVEEVVNGYSPPERSLCVVVRRQLMRWKTSLEVGIQK
jgi:hypothetical protein